MINNPLINEVFRGCLEDFLFGNLVIKNTRSPLILAVFGPTGEGKTFQIDKICQSLGISQTIISPGELESENAGRPAQLLRELYIGAGTLKKGATHTEPAVLVINDIDTVLGNWGEMVQYTVNRQTLYGQLMALCDFPNQVSGHTVKRVPIIITGNNPSILYPPLLRPGRMRLMPWIPTVKDKAQIVSRIFTGVSMAALEKLIEKYKEQPISFWSDIDARLREIKLRAWLNSNSREDLLNSLHSGKEYSMKESEVTFGELEKIASDLKNANISKKNFLT